MIWSLMAFGSFVHGAMLRRKAKSSSDLDSSSSSACSSDTARVLTGAMNCSMARIDSKYLYFGIKGATEVAWSTAGSQRRDLNLLQDQDGHLNTLSFEYSICDGMFRATIDQKSDSDDRRGKTHLSRLLTFSPKRTSVVVSSVQL